MAQKVTKSREYATIKEKVLFIFFVTVDILKLIFSKTMVK